MYNCLIMGSGRSGTSMVTGTLSKSGYYMGPKLIPPRNANPKGFFESSFINRDINEALMKPLISNMSPGQYWLADLPTDINLAVTEPIEQNIKHAVAQEPFCYKDPRFSFTLHAWRPYLKNTRFVCVFRHPASTATSIVKECQDAPYLRSLNMTHAAAYENYRAVYESILHKHQHIGNWLFVHYDQMLTIAGVARLADFLQAEVDATFPEKQFKRSTELGKVPSNIMNIFHRLLDLSQ